MTLYVHGSLIWLIYSDSQISVSARGVSLRAARITAGLRPPKSRRRDTPLPRARTPAASRRRRGANRFGHFPFLKTSAAHARTNFLARRERFLSPRPLRYTPARAEELRDAEFGLRI